MSKDTPIEWTHHTFNTHWGCTRVSPGCGGAKGVGGCYAEAFAHRLGLDIWGPDKPRRLFGDKHWNEPLRWNDSAARRGVRERVFCASMADVFEEHADLPPVRERLFRLIETTPALDWQLLTKRPENLCEMLPATWLDAPRQNVWIGTTCEDQRHFDLRAPVLRDVPAAVRFISFEPLLGPIDTRQEWERDEGDVGHATRLDDLRLGPTNAEPPLMARAWAIVGGESGPGARPCDVEWIRSIVRQCHEASVPVFVKQDSGPKPGKRGRIPDDLWIKEFPNAG